MAFGVFKKLTFKSVCSVLACLLDTAGSEYSVKAYDRENGERRYTDGEKEKESETV